VRSPDRGFASARIHRETDGDLVAVVPLECAVRALTQTFTQLQRQAERVGNRLRVCCARCRSLE
jgi:hypothetical protein